MRRLTGRIAGPALRDVLRAHAEEEHVLVAGRAISSDHGANSALRVQASCMAIGQSAGVVAALAARQGVDPRAVPIDAAKRQLRAIGAIVP